MLPYSYAEPRPMESAPRDGTVIRLLVDFTGVRDGCAGPLTDDEKSWTIGSNSFDHTEEDVWNFVGWDWCQDVYANGYAPESGKIVGWLPFYDDIRSVDQDWFELWVYNYLVEHDTRIQQLGGNEEMEIDERRDSARDIVKEARKILHSGEPNRGQDQ